MKVIYAGQELPEIDHDALPHRKHVPNSIFFAGPTPRSKEVQSWRPEALAFLKSQGFDGYVFVPEGEQNTWHGNYNTQVHWEWEALGKAACTLFWVPRNLENMHGFTTNVELGFMVALRPSRIVLGSPPDTPKMRYLRKMLTDVTEFHRFFDMAPNFVGIDPKPLMGGSLQSCLLLAMGVANPEDVEDAGDTDQA